MAKNFSINEANKAFINFYGNFYPLKNDKKILLMIRILFIKYYDIKWSLFNLKQKLINFLIIFLKKIKIIKLIWILKLIQSSIRTKKSTKI